MKLAWSEPYLQSAHPEVSTSFSFDGNLVITIEMNEEIPTPFSIATFVNYQGSESPLANNFQSGISTNLEMNFVRNNSIWQMRINRKQDYENPEMRSYSFFLNEIDGIRAFVRINVKNIFDNFPVVTQITNPCQVFVS